MNLLTFLDRENIFNWLKLIFAFLDEESSTLVVNELLTLKKGPDPALLELEDKARDALLEKVRFLRIASKQHFKNSLLGSSWTKRPT